MTHGIVIFEVFRLPLDVVWSEMHVGELRRLVRLLEHRSGQQACILLAMDCHGIFLT